MTDEYDKTWGTPVGQDCIDLCSTLPRWLGERLTFMGNYTQAAPPSYVDEFGDGALDAWRDELTTCGNQLSRWANAGTLELSSEGVRTALRDATRALHWVADNLPTLWD